MLLKLSGEALAGEQGLPIDPEVVGEFAQEIKEVHALGCELAIVIGGGNIVRGLSASEQGIDRATGDYMVALLGEKRLRRGESDRLEALVPSYVRASAAERNLERVTLTMQNAVS